MAFPIKGDRLTAKVRMTFYIDAECKKAFPPVPPGVGYKKSFQYAERMAGEEVGIFTGVSNEISYQVDWVQQYRHVPGWPLKAQTIIKPRTSFVKKNEVTGNWDTGVDAPKVTPPPVADEQDNTNLLLAGAVGVAAFAKFILPNLKK